MKKQLLVASLLFVTTSFCTDQVPAAVAAAQASTAASLKKSVRLLPLVTGVTVLTIFSVMAVINFEKEKNDAKHKNSSDWALAGRAIAHTTAQHFNVLGSLLNHAGHCIDRALDGARPTFCWQTSEAQQPSDTQKTCCPQPKATEIGTNAFHSGSR